MLDTTQVAVVGATGYAGAALASILAHHPGAEVKGLYCSASAGSTTSEPGTGPRPFNLENVAGSGATVVFLATPNEVSAEIAPKLLGLGLKVIDLSGAFRLRDARLYPNWYGFTHQTPSLLDEAVYGLTEFCNGELKTARLVANPGCYPTSILLALRPLTFLIDRNQPVICDSKSGVSGAGRKAGVDWSFAEVSGNFKAYSVGHHRHEPEIRQGLRLGDRASVVFVPHLLPAVRGILSTMHVGFTRPVAETEIMNIYAEWYAGAPLVQVLPAGQLPELKDVVNTPRAEIGFQLLEGGRRVVVVSVIDNLLKGAASQAVQNFNRMCGYGETEGLS
jgi:N-acetyl-gamma-glutamyl-phosphate reductase